MQTYNQIIETIRQEIASKSIASVQKCRERIQSLCTEFDCMQNLLPISLEFGVA